MATQVRGFGMDENGNRVQFAGQITRHHKKSEKQLIAWTAGPQTAWQKFKRSAVG